MKQYRLNVAIAYRGLADGIDSREAQKAVDGIEEILKKKSQIIILYTKNVVLLKKLHLL